MNKAEMGFSVPLWPLDQNTMVWDNANNVPAQSASNYGQLSQPTMRWFEQVLESQPDGSTKWLARDRRSTSSFRQFAWWYWAARRLHLDDVSVNLTMTHYTYVNPDHVWVPWDSTVTFNGTVTLEDMAGKEDHPWEVAPTVKDKLDEAGTDERARQLVLLWNRARGIIDWTWEFYGTASGTESGTEVNVDGTYNYFSNSVDIAFSVGMPSTGDPPLVLDMEAGTTSAALRVVSTAGLQGYRIFNHPLQSPANNVTTALKDTDGKELADFVHMLRFKMNDPGGNVSYESANTSTIGSITVIPWAA